MNDVQQAYAPPRATALIAGLGIFTLYQFGRRPELAAPNTTDGLVPLVLAVLFSLVLGYGLTMLIWLIRRTYGQVWYTFRPTRGRIIGAICLAMVTPLAVFNYLPWVVGGLIPFAFMPDILTFLIWTLVPTLAAYPLAAMIVRHTYQRRWLRFGLFSLSFWAAYAGHMLWSGVVMFRL